VFGKEVTLHTFGNDKYGRTIADVLLPDGTNVNHTPVKEGWCWWYRKYAPGNTVLEGLEKEAREARKGLWADPALILHIPVAWSNNPANSATVYSHSRCHPCQPTHRNTPLADLRLVVFDRNGDYTCIRYDPLRMFSDNIWTVLRRR